MPEINHLCFFFFSFFPPKYGQIAFICFRKVQTYMTKAVCQLCHTQLLYSITTNMFNNHSALSGHNTNSKTNVSRVIIVTILKLDKHCLVTSVCQTCFGKHDSWFIVFFDFMENRRKLLCNCGKRVVSQPCLITLMVMVKVLQRLCYGSHIKHQTHDCIRKKLL